MRFVCDSCRAQYMISDEKVGAKGVKVRCKKCGFVILVRRPQDLPPQPPEPSDATQVMQNPLADSVAGGSPFEDTTVAAGKGLGGVDKLFGGVEEDEIGAVFDQVLSSGTQKPSAADPDRTEDRFGDLGGDLGDPSDDRMSTRVLDAATVKKLTQEAATGSDAPNAALEGAATPASEPKPDPAKHDWFVAIDEKQVGPLSLEKIKQHWDEGEIGPDSLCWRAGFSDWLPLSEVQDLTAILAPQPKKPVIVSSASMEPTSGGMVNVPGESKSNPAAAASAPQEDSGWRPSAASALASLVQEEIEALARPAPSPKPAAFEPTPKVEKAADGPRGLLDLPSQEVHVPAHLLKQHAEASPAARPSASERMPLGAQHRDPPSTVGPAPYTTTFRPPSAQKTSKAVVYGGAAALGVVVLLIGVVVWMMFRQQEQIAEITRKPADAVVVAKNDAPPPSATGTPAAAQAEPAVQPAKADASAKPEEPAKPAEATKDAAAEPEPKRENRRSTEREPKKVAARTELAPESEPTPKAEPERREEPTGGSDDDFEELFGGSRKPAPKKTEEKKSSGRSVYVPPAPGQQEIPTRLAQSDVLQVVVSQRSALANCTAEQKKRDPDLSGTLVMRWTIQTNGRPTRVSPQTAEFKSTYLATCIGGVIKGMKFPAHKEQGAPIDFPFKF